MGIVSLTCKRRPVKGAWLNGWMYVVKSMRNIEKKTIVNHP